jgi:hypothetical protein
VPGLVSSVGRDRATLLLALAIAAASFAIAFGFAADADRGAPAAAAPRAPRHEPHSPEVALGPAPSLRVRASLLAPPARPARRRPVQRRVEPAPAVAPQSPAPLAPVDGTQQPLQSSPPQSAPQPSPPPQSAPPSPPPRPAPKPRPKPTANPKPPKPVDFDDKGPPAPGKDGSGDR